MLGLRRWAATVTVTMAAAGACVPGGPPPNPSDEIKVTYLTHPDGDPLGPPEMLNERGEVVASSDPWSRFLVEHVVWNDGEVTSITPRVARRVLDISNRGELVGMHDADLLPFSWIEGKETLLPLGDAYGGTAFAVNDHGKVAGTLRFGKPSDYEERPVVWRDGEIIVAPWDIESVAGIGVVGINNRSEVAMTVSIDGNLRAMVWKVGGEVIDLGTLGGDRSTVEAINDRGMVLGNSTTPDGEHHPFLWHRGEMVDLGSLGGNLTLGTDLNEWGQVVGSGLTADGEAHSFLWDDGDMTRLDVFGATYSGVAAINNWGQVVGTFEADGVARPFLWQRGRVVDLAEAVDQDLGAAEVIDINDRGQVLGFTTDDPTWPPPWTAVMWTVPPLWGYTDGPDTTR